MFDSSVVYFFSQVDQELANQKSMLTVRLKDNLKLKVTNMKKNPKAFCKWLLISIHSVQ